MRRKSSWRTRTCVAVVVGVVAGISWRRPCHAESSALDSPKLACFLGPDEARDVSLDTSTLAACAPGAKAQVISKDCWDAPSPQSRVLCEHFLQQLAASTRSESLCARVPHLRYTDLCRPEARSASDMEIPRTRTLALQSVDSLPSLHRSTRCHGCAYEGNGGKGASLLVYDPHGAHSLADGEIVGTNRWSMFLQVSGVPVHTTGRVLQHVPAGMRCSRRVSQPTIMFDLLGWHVGHLIIDVFEALYEAVSEIRAEGKEPLVIIDVADKDDVRHYDASLMADRVHGAARSSAFSLLRRFSNFTIHSKRTFDLLPGVTCFDESVQVQLDVRRTFSVRGPDLDDLVQRRARYSALRAFLTADFPHAPPSPPTRDLRVTVVRRVGARIVTNFDGLTTTIAGIDGVKVREVALEKMTFMEQIELFTHETDVLVCQQGTAAHNAIFMPPETAMVLWMQPGWCAWHWQFTSQALVGSQRAIAVCQPPANYLESHRFPVRWHRKGWLQGPWWSKDVFIAVDPALAREAVELALAPAGSSAGADAAVLLGEDLVEDRGAGFESTCAASNTASTCADQEPSFRMPSARAVIAQLDVSPAPSGASSAYKLVLEAAFDKPAPDMFPSLAAQEAFMFSHQLCIRMWDMGARTDRDHSQEDRSAREGAAACFPSSVFNEFSTLDLSTADGQDWVAEVWLEGLAAAQTQDSQVRTPSARESSSFQLLHPSLAGLTKLARPVTVGDKASASDLATLQEAVARACPSSENLRVCAYLARTYGHRLSVGAAAARAGVIPAPLWMPSRRNPFVFLHLEKTAGTCFRNILDQTSREAPELEAFLPCHGGVPCMTFSLEAAPRTANVLGGHFDFGQWKSWSGEAADPYCATIQRHPVARAISYYYERVYSSVQVRLNELPIENLTFVMQQWRGSAHGRWRDEGLSDAGCKMLCGLSEFRGLRPEEAPRAGDPAAPACTRALATQRLEDNCLVGLQERWEDTRRVFSFFLPWAAPGLREGCPATTHGSNRRAVIYETMDTISEAARKVIEEHNQCDLALYASAQAKFERQLAFVAQFGEA